jgi:hypothetical protein
MEEPVYPGRTTDHGQATGKLYHLQRRVECTLFVIYKARLEKRVTFDTQDEDKKQNKATTQYTMDTIIREQTPYIRHEPSYELNLEFMYIVFLTCLTSVSKS